MPYCETSDLFVGDLTVSSGTLTRFVAEGAAEMDAALSTVYEIPLAPLPPSVALPEYALLNLKRCNQLLGSGRLFLDRAAVAEDDGLHQYGLSLLQEGQALLRSIVSGTVYIPAVKIPVQAGEGNAPTIHQSDSTSGVDAFYDFVTDRSCTPWYGPTWRPGS